MRFVISSAATLDERSGHGEAATELVNDNIQRENAMMSTATSNLQIAGFL
jgi:hypothetical protein